MADNNRIGGQHYEIMKRCYNPKSILYKNYGAKGIKVCEEWHDREIFRKWCIENGFKVGLKVLRHDNTKDYCPENCYLGEGKTTAKYGYSHLVRIRAKANKERKAKLGLKRLIDSPFYKMFQSMHDRCELQSNNNYKYYGGAGIKVCDEWSGKDGFYNFSEWILNSNYRPGLTLDRIDPYGNYEPNNCRWATTNEQGRNKKNTKLYTYKGLKLTIAEIARMESIKDTMLRYRINDKKMSVEDAIADIKNKT